MSAFRQDFHVAREGKRNFANEVVAMMLRMCIACLLGSLYLTVPCRGADDPPSILGHVGTMSVQSGGQSIDVAKGIAKIDAGREVIFRSISGQLSAKDYNLSPQIQKLEQLIDVSNRLSDQIRMQHPNHREVQGWLRANALVASAWLNLLRNNVPFSQSAYGDEVAWLQNVGTPLDGKLGDRIAKLHELGSNPDKERRLLAIARLVQNASNIAGKGEGLLDCLVSITPRFADPGMNVVVQAVGNLKSETKTGEKVTFRIHVSGPDTSYQMPPAEATYALGSPVLGQKFAVDTSKFKPGKYEVTVLADDARGQRRTAAGIFLVADASPLPAEPTPAPNGDPPFEQYIHYRGQFGTGAKLTLTLAFRRLLTDDKKWTFRPYVYKGEVALTEGGPSTAVGSRITASALPEFSFGDTVFLLNFGDSAVETTGFGTFAKAPTLDTQTISGKVTIHRERKTRLPSKNPNEIGGHEIKVEAAADPGGTYDWTVTRVP